MIITLTGGDAFTVARAANLQPEILDRGLWVLAPSFATVRGMLGNDANGVRLKASPKALVENILRVGLASDDEVASAIQQGLRNGVHTDELAIIQRAIPA